jgi:hypothetical protein
MPGSGSHKLTASAFWFPSIGPGANSNANAATVNVINDVMVDFDFTDV